MRQNCGWEAFQESDLRSNRDFKCWTFFEINGIWAKTGQATPLSPMSGSKIIMRHMSQWDNPDRSRDDPRRERSENLT